MSADSNNEYFCDGLAEELLNALAKIECLKVAARTSAFSFKGKDVDVREIGRKLGVGAVLEGSVRKVGSQLRISAQLISVTDGYSLWSERYDRHMEDVFRIQDELSLAIVDGLKLKLPGSDRASLLKRYTDNEQAYQSYLKGRFHQNKWTPEGIRKSVEFFEQAIAIDENYSLAYAGLADSFVSLGAANAFGLPVSETASKAKAAAVRALEIDNTLAEAHSSLALVKLNFEWDWAGAEKEFKRALELNPNYASGHHWYSHYLIAMGRMDESLAASRRVLELNPLDLETNIHLGWHYYFARDYDRVLEVVRKTLELDSTFSEAYWLMGWACEQKGQYDEAIAAYHRSSLLEAKPEILAWLGHAYALSGNRAEAQKLLEKIEDDSKLKYVSPYWMAIINLGLNEDDETFEWLQKACDERNAWLVYLNVNPLFDRIRTDRRFEQLLEQLGLDQRKYTPQNSD
jgi:TolB-like protein